MQPDERLQLADRLRLAADGHHRLEARLQRLEPKALEACDLGLGEERRREVGERRPAPDRERASQRRLRLVERAGAERTLSGGEQALELVGVDLARRDREPVAGGFGDERAVAARLTVVQQAS